MISNIPETIIQALIFLSVVLIAGFFFGLNYTVFGFFMFISGGSFGFGYLYWRCGQRLNRLEKIIEEGRKDETNSVCGSGRGSV